jgi:2,3,4,5-tetrahydropyridine-2-carboxylate N-succinyltransferase
MTDLQKTIDQAWDQRTELSPSTATAAVRDAVEHVIAELDAGRMRVAEKVEGDWVVHQWIKKAVLLSFRLEDNRPIEAGALSFYDKVPTKFEGWSPQDFAAGAFMVALGAFAL